MRVLFWNVRGCNKLFKQKEIKAVLQENKVDVAVLLETRVRLGKSQKIQEKICRGWNAVNNYGFANNGRIWVSWNPRKVVIKEVQGHEQALVCEVVDVFTGLSQILVAVYASNTHDQRKRLWEFLKVHCRKRQEAMLIGGDFNAILKCEDRLNGNHVQQKDLEDFQNCIDEIEMQEVRAIGPQYTWNNNQEGEDRIWSNIDRCFANDKWFDAYSRVVVERLVKGVSDHCPQLVRFDRAVPQKSLFRFFNALADHESFSQILQEKWDIGQGEVNLRSVWRKCQLLKGPLKQLNTRWFTGVSDKIAGFRRELYEVQLQSQHGNLSEIQREKDLLAQIEKWDKIEESIWQQKSRIDWISLGDSNTRFFHAAVKQRQNCNAIYKLVTAEGRELRGQEQIKNEIREFYKKLMGNANEELPMLDRAVMRSGAKLNIHQMRELAADCIESEVKEALFSMNSLKAPGIDGFNVYFFKKSWHLIGREVVIAVQKFFSTGILPKEINVALLTLIPKCPNADMVRNFRPIACCSVLYKIISKVLANRLKGVLDGIISQNQSAFVPGRIIFDNILLSNELIKG